MTTRYLLEYDCDLITAHLKSVLPGILSALRIQRNDPTVSTEPPRSYFKYEKARGYEAPAVFVIGETMDFRQAEKGANHVNAESQVNVTVVVEDKSSELLQKKSYRYMAALHEALEQANLQSSDQKLKIVVRVARAENSPLYSNAKDEKSANAVFRKEVSLICEVDHFENF
jgi:hypothetical protein